MFKINYRVVHSDYDDFVGQNGFLQIKCNDYIYGEIYPNEIEKIMDKVSLYNWFERLVKVLKYLDTKQYVALSDVESYNTWIEFQRNNAEVIISIVKADKEEGSHDIEFNLKSPIAGQWGNQVICYNQLATEILQTAREYIDFVTKNNTEQIDFIFENP